MSRDAPLRNTGRQSEVDARWPKIALCAVHDEWWAVEREHDDKCPYPSCNGPVTVYVPEPPEGAVEALRALLRLVDDTEYVWESEAEKTEKRAVISAARTAAGEQ